MYEAECSHALGRMAGWRVNGDEARPITCACFGILRPSSASCALHILTTLPTSSLRVWIGRISKEGHCDRSGNTMLTEIIQELATVTDENIYNLMRNSDYTMGRWTDEDPSLRNVQRWLRSRR